MLVYKIFRQPEWAALVAAGQSLGAPVDLSDDFIHLSTARQVEETAAKHFAGVEDLVLVALDADRLGPSLRWEPSRGGALFPHLYRPIRREEVLWHQPLPLGRRGHEFPRDLR